MVESQNGTVNAAPLPSFITESYFSKILENHEPDFHSIQNFEANHASAPGENFCSALMRVKVVFSKKDGSLETKSFIVKTTFESLDSQSTASVFLDNIKAFPKEKLMYQHILPKCSNLYKEQGSNVKIGPQCVFLEETPERTTFIFEDLTKENFSNIDRLQGCDMPHMEATLQKLAEYHAATAVLGDLEGPYDPMFDLTFYSESNRDLMKQAQAMQLPILAKCMRQWDLENVEHYIATIPDGDKVMDSAQEANRANPNDFNVLNHGDFWSNNVMFQHDDKGNVTDTLFVDFQMSKWGSPAQDLWYFIVSSAALDIKLEHFDYFIYHYHKHLEKSLKLLKYRKRIPSLVDIHITVIKHNVWGFLTMFGVLQAVLLPPDADATLDNMLYDGPESAAMLEKRFLNPHYVRVVRKLYPFLDLKGGLSF